MTDRIQAGGARLARKILQNIQQDVSQAKAKTDVGSSTCQSFHR